MEEKHPLKRFTIGQYRMAGATALVVVLLFVCGILGSGRITRYVGASMEESILQSESEYIAESIQESVQESIEESKREETAVHEVALSYVEEQLLNLLMEKLDAGEIEAAARILNNNESAFQNLFFEKLADSPALYDGARMTDRVEGRGLVFTRATTLFYGEFLDGKPEGQGIALQALHLDEGVRYDYSKGSWSSGRMNGAGECGYNYYEGVVGDSIKESIKTGTFVNDLMEGDITYTSINGEGEATTWSFKVLDGIIVKDERWSEAVSEDGSKTYQRMADTDEVHAYVVNEADFGEVRWKNMIEF